MGKKALSTRILAYRWFYLVVFGTVMLDRLTKWMIQLTLPYGSYDKSNMIEVIPGFFYLCHIGNTGAAWGIFHDRSFMLAVFAILALGFIFVFRRGLGIAQPVFSNLLGHFGRGNNRKSHRSPGPRARGGFFRPAPRVLPMASLQYCRHGHSHRGVHLYLVQHQDQFNRDGTLTLYSMLATCSRRRSSSFLKAMTWREMRMSLDLLPMVLISRFISCSKKSVRRPTGPVDSKN